MSARYYEKVLLNLLWGPASGDLSWPVTAATLSELTDMMKIICPGNYKLVSAGNTTRLDLLDSAIKLEFDDSYEKIEWMLRWS